MRIGAQFYTIRDYCTNLIDFSESLKKIADIGYEFVQISGVCDYKADWLKKELLKNNLKCVLTHISQSSLENNINTVIENHNILDCKYVGLGYMPFEDNKEKQAIDNMVKTFVPIARKLKDSGKYFMYHNHAAEFKKLKNKTILEYLSDAFSEDEMGFTIDTYWVQVGGGDPAEWIEKLSGRVPCIHLKDCDFSQKMSVIGEGNINFNSVFKAAEKSKTEYLLVEQDDCNGENPFDCLKRSYENLKSYGFR